MAPFLTSAAGVAWRTWATITSPRYAKRRTGLPSTRIILAVPAPVLSATSHSVSIWITVNSPSCPGLLRGGAGARLREHLHETPPLELGERARLADLDRVAHLRLALLVVRVELGVAPEVLLV